MLLVIVAIVTHHAWFNPENVLTFSDWIVWPAETVERLAFTAGAWMPFTNFGASNVQMQFLLFMGFWTALLKAGLTYNMAIQITFLIPIAIMGFLAPYAFFMKLTRSRWVALMVALFYGTTSYFLMRQTAHLPIAFAYALAPLVLWAFENAAERKSMRSWLIFSFVCAIGICYEVRIMFILAFVVCAYAACFHAKSLLKHWKAPAIACLLLIAFNLFWILPAFGGTFREIGTFAGRQLFGSAFFDLAHAFALSEPFWSGSKPKTDFIVQPILWHLWLIPVLCFSALLLRGNPRSRRTVFFAALALLGIVLSKQSAAPFPGLYSWLYGNVPGFSLFREASKFYLLIALGYAGLLASLLSGLRERKQGMTARVPYVSVSAAVVLVAFLNVRPLLTGEIGTLFTPRRMPAEYLTLQKLLSSQKEYFRTAWVPRASRWGFFSASHPSLNAVDVISAEWSALVEQGPPSLPDAIVRPFQKSYADWLLDISSVKYVVVPLRDTGNDDDFFMFYGGEVNPAIREWYVSQLDAQPYLRKLQSASGGLALYENADAKPYVRPIASVSMLDSLENLEEKYTFVTEALGEGFDFFTADPSKNVPAHSVYALFEDLSPESISSEGFVSRIPVSGEGSWLYEKKGGRSFSYVFDGERMAVFSDRSGALKTPVSSSGSGALPPVPLYEASMKQGNYAALLGDSLVPLGLAASPRIIGSSTLPLELVTVGERNFLPNPSFEYGLWAPKVGDCHAYDDRPILDMRLSDVASDGFRSLELSATRHIACTGVTVGVRPGMRYRLSFDYQSDDAPHAGYYVEFPGSASGPLQGRLPVNGNGWQGFSRVVEIPNDVSSLTLVLYSYANDDGKTEMITRYDDFRLETLTSFASIPAQAAGTTFVKTPLTDTAAALMFADSSYAVSNLIANPGFEEGLWAKEVGDCHNYDRNPMLDMSRAEGGTEGRYALELGAVRHFACTGPAPLPVAEGAQYLFSFDYQSPDAGDAGYHISFNDPGQTVVQERLATGDASWKSFHRQIVAPAGVTSASLILYAYERDGVRRTATRYDNVSLVQLPDILDRYYVMTPPPVRTMLPDELTFSILNPSRTSVRVRGARGPFYLALGESYHDQWRLHFDNKKVRGPLAAWWPLVSADRVPDAHHVMLDGFLNGWYVDVDEYCGRRNLCTVAADGSYEMDLVIEFFPQRWYYLGLLLSAMSAAGALAFIGGDLLTRKSSRRAFPKSKR